MLMRGEDHPEKEIGAVVGIDRAGVLADPPDAGLLSPGLLKYGSGVDIVAVVAPEALLQQATTALQALLNDPVIVGAARVGCDLRMIARGVGDSRRTVFSIVNRGYDDTPDVFEDFLRILAPLGVSGEIVHVSSVAPVNPLAELFRARGFLGIGKAYPVEAIVKLEITEFFC